MGRISLEIIGANLDDVTLSKHFNQLCRDLSGNPAFKNDAVVINKEEDSDNLFIGVLIDEIRDNVPLETIKDYINDVIDYYHKHECADEKLKQLIDIKTSMVDKYDEFISTFNSNISIINDLIDNYRNEEGNE